jgi:hypothetical protein
MGVEMIEDMHIYKLEKNITNQSSNATSWLDALTRAAV